MYKKVRPPVVIFAYRRALSLERLFESLRVCNGFFETDVFVFIDGAKSEVDRVDVEKTYETAIKFATENVQIIRREKNIGLKGSIFSGVGEICRSFGRVIVLEDDLEVSDCILDFFRDALDKYADDPRVWSVNGYMYRGAGPLEEGRAVVLPWAAPWGWATWDRAWSKFELNRPLPASMLRSNTFARRFDLEGLRDFSAMLRLARNGLVSSWYIEWYLTIFEAGGVSIFPPRTMVRNTGIGSAGATHGSSLNPYQYLSRSDTLLTTVPTMPEELCIDWMTLDRMRFCWDARLQRAISFAGRLKRRFKTFRAYIGQRLRISR